MSVAAILLAGVLPAGSSGRGDPLSFTSVAHSLGLGHYCAVTNSGGVACWGSNDYGELGLGNHRGYRLRPVSVVGLDRGIKQVSAGGSHTCAVTTRGGVKCWGKNVSGQLGNGTTKDSYVPVDVVGLGAVIKEVSAGDLHTCALTTAGGVKCWGKNTNGELGDGHVGDGANRSRPVNVIGLSSGIKQVAAGRVGNPNAQVGDLGGSCALTTGGTVKCWGTEPRDVPGHGTDVAAIDSSVGCVLTTAGAERCRDKVVPGLESGVKQISESCALMNTGAVRCLKSTNGILGVDSAPVPGLASGVRQISGNCALMNTGWIKCWGCPPRGNGQRYRGTDCTRLPPVDVLTPIPAKGAGGGTATPKPAGGSTPRLPARPGASVSVPGGCTRATAITIAKRLHLLNADFTSTPVAQVLCGSFAGPGSKAMVFSLTVPGCGRTGGWVLFRSPSAGTWQLVQEVHEGGDLAAVGSGIRQTQYVLRPADAHCFPTGGTRSRVWRWNGSRLTSDAWKYSKPRSRPTQPGTTLTLSLSAVSPQRVLVQKGITVQVHCSQACTLTATGIISILDATYRTSLIDAHATLGDAGTATLTLRLRRFDVGFLPRAMKGLNGKATLKITARDRAGHELHRQRVIVISPARTATAPTAPSGSQQALRSYTVSLENLLADLARGRARLTSALGGALNCTLAYQTAANEVERVVDNRSRIWNQLNGTRPPTVETATLKTTLSSALDHSIAADRHYRSWLLTLARGPAGCPPPTNAAFTAAGREDVQATSLKQRFVTTFNPIARRLGLRTWTAAEF